MFGLVCCSAPYIHTGTRGKYRVTVIWSVHNYSSLSLSLLIINFPPCIRNVVPWQPKNDMKYCGGPFQHLEWKIMVQLRLVLGLNWVKGGLLPQTNTTFIMCACKQSPRLRCPLTFHLVLTAWQGRTAHSGTFNSRRALASREGPHWEPALIQRWAAQRAAFVSPQHESRGWGITWSPGTASALVWRTEDEIPVKTEEIPLKLGVLRQSPSVCT